MAHLELEQATRVIIGGGSAGGVASLLHVDRIAAQLPESARVSGAPFVALFLDFDFNGTHGYSGQRRVDFPRNMKYAAVLRIGCLLAIE